MSDVCIILRQLLGHGENRKIHYIDLISTGIGNYTYTLLKSVVAIEFTESQLTLTTFQKKYRSLSEIQNYN